ncbi:MAG: ABC transporter permease subunit [Oscillospiraceae bacterium]|nr:ABC transporter permease subunit [Oscillospiraceae bacterium]
MGKGWRRWILPLAFWLAVWALAAALVGRELLLPGPGWVALTLWELVQSPDFWRSSGASLGRVMGGFLLGSLLGMALGALTAAFRWCDALLSPALRTVRTVPVVSFILLLFFWLPIPRVPTVVAALMALPIVWRATRQGIDDADPRLLELAGQYRLSPWSRFRLIYLPQALPALWSGWETALGLAWKSGVAAEVLCQPKWAMGTGLQSAKAYLDSAGLFAWTVAIVVLSLVLEGLLKWAFRLWKGGGEA